MPNDERPRFDGQFANALHIGEDAALCTTLEAKAESASQTAAPTLGKTDLTAVADAVTKLTEAALADRRFPTARLNAEESASRGALQPRLCRHG